MRLTRIVVLALVLLCLPGCSLLGFPSKEEVRAAEAKYEQAERDLGAVGKELDKIRAERDAASRQKESVDAQREALSQVQARIALELGNAPKDARPFLEDQLDAIRRQARSIDGTAKQFAETIASYDSEIASAAAAQASAQKALDLRHADELAAMRQRAEEAKDKVSASIAGLGQLVGNYVPGAGKIGEDAAKAVSGALALGTLGFGATTWRAMRKKSEAEEERDEAVAQRDGARKVIAITERHGMARIVADPNVKALARNELTADPVATQEFGIATALGKTAMRIAA